jgi:hypothetical protein
VLLLLLLGRMLQARVLLRLNRPVDVAERGLVFVQNFLGLLAAKEAAGQLKPWLKEVRGGVHYSMVGGGMGCSVLNGSMYRSMVCVVGLLQYGINRMLCSAVLKHGVHLYCGVMCWDAWHVCIAFCLVEFQAKHTATVKAGVAHMLPCHLLPPDLN